MAVDRSWIRRRSNPDGYGFTEEYCHGVDEFVAFAERNCTEPNGLILCPCKVCKNLHLKSVFDVKYDLIAIGFLESYNVWYYHGEVIGGGSSNQRRNIQYGDVFDQTEMLRDAFGEDYTNHEEEPNPQAAEFLNNVNGYGAPIYPGNIRYTQLTFVMKLLHFKNRHGCSEKGFNELLCLIGDVFPADHKLPENYDDCKKMVKKLNLGYDKIHACENDCMLFYGEDSHRKHCKYCELSRYKDAKPGGSRTIPRKILRYFRLTDRLQRLYMSGRTAEQMRWYKNRVVTEGVITHPADGEEWKEFDRNYPDFAQEIRNVRIGLATDGFPPYNNGTSSQYSVWPVVAILYNLPPSMCMKDPYMFMTLLVPGPNDPGKNLNVYLRPLIDELIQLWQVGVHTYDAFTKTNFTLRAALLWTMSDFPGLGMVSGWSTHGKMCCHVCMGDVRAKQLPFSRKCSFYGLHKGFLDKRRKKRRTGFAVRSMLAGIVFPPPGKPHSKERADGFGVSHNWTHVTSFFDLPYWDSLRLRHCIDVMHTEKNVFDNIFHTIINSAKTKDTTFARQDLEALGIMKALWLQGNRNPRAKYCLTREQLKLLCNWVRKVQLPDGCSSNIKRCVKVPELKFHGMKSHDCHVFMQKFIPSAFRELLPDEVFKAICDLSNFFRDLCSTTLLESDLKKMEKNIVGIVCTLETIFTPSFFDPMEHLLVHLVEECRLGGPCNTRWQYGLERLQRRLKQKVGNKARVEGSIAERYVQEELSHFCSMYFESSIQTAHNRLGRNEVDDNFRDPKKLEEFTYPVKLQGAYTNYHLDEDSYLTATHYVLTNIAEVGPYITIFEQEVRNHSPNPVSDAEMDVVLKSNLVNWLQQKVQDNFYVSERFKYLLRGPTTLVLSYKRCKVNGYAFNLGRSSSGVLVKGSCYDNNSYDYYGTLEDIINLTYDGGNQVILFKCHWFDPINGVKKDKNGVVLIDINSKLAGNDVYILASQATQVYYAPSVKNPDSNIYTVITTRARPLDEIGHNAEVEAFQEEVTNTNVVTFPNMSLFIDLSQYDMGDGDEEPEPENMVISEDEEENEVESEEEEDGYESIEEEEE